MELISYLLSLVILISFDSRCRFWENLLKSLPGTKKADNRKDNSCKDKNEGMLHILAPGFFYKQF